MAYLSIEPAAGLYGPLVVVDASLATDTQYSLGVGGAMPDFGNASWDHVFSGPRGTQGARPAFGVPKNRESHWPIKIRGLSADDLTQRKARLAEVCDDLRKYGGQLVWKGNQQTYKQYFRVLVSELTQTNHDNRAEHLFTSAAQLDAVCAPYLEGDPMDTFDGFDTNTISDYTKDGAVSVTVANGALVPASTGAIRYRHTAKGYRLQDAEITLKVTTGATIANGVWGVSLADRTGANDTAVTAEIVQSGNLLRITDYLLGVATTTTAAFTPAASTSYWIRLRTQGGRATAEVFTTEPTAVTTATATVTRLDHARVFPGGHAGFRITCVDVLERYDDFRCEPFTYKFVASPLRLSLAGEIPGDALARADLSVTPFGGIATPIYGALGWCERARYPNRCWNGDLEDTTVAASGWTNAAVAGVIGAATSVARDTTAARNKYGLANLSIVCPATASTGGSFQIYESFVAGRTYAALAWKSSAAGVTTTQLLLGVSGDLASSVATALTATPTLDAVIWQPSVSQVVDSATVGAQITAATATTWSVDGVCVFESTPIRIATALGNNPVTDVTLACSASASEIPGLGADGRLSAPFLILLEKELCRVTAVTISALGGEVTAMTIDRAQEGSVVATHATTVTGVIAPPLEHRQGKGAHPPFGIIEGEACVPALTTASVTPVVTVDANSRGGRVMRWVPAGAGTGTFVWFIDPSLLVPDDYTLGEIDVNVLMRFQQTTGIGTSQMTLSCLPEKGTTAGYTRYSRQFVQTGVLVTPPTATAYRKTFLGTLPLIVDKANPQRWRLQLTVVAAAAGTFDIDYLAILPTRNGSSAMSPTGRVNDTALTSGNAFPAFVPFDAGWGAASSKTKTLRSDGSALIAVPGSPAYPDHGLGRVIEIPGHELDLVCLFSNMVPDDASATSFTDENVASSLRQVCLHAAVTPRYALARNPVL